MLVSIRDVQRMSDMQNGRTPKAMRDNEGFEIRHKRRAAHLSGYEGDRLRSRPLSQEQGQGRHHRDRGSLHRAKARDARGMAALVKPSGLR